jgi:integrase
MQTDTLTQTNTKTESKARPNPRGVYEKFPGSGEWWIRYVDASGCYRREKAGTKSAAIKLADKRRTEALQGKKLPETLRQRVATFKEIATDALDYSRLHKRSFRDDRYRMARLQDWFGERPAQSLTPGEIERRLAGKEWTPATSNRHRSLLSLAFRLAVRAGKVKENPVRQVTRRKENNIRVRFLDAKEESALREQIRKLNPEHEAEFDLALHTGLRRNEQYRLRWESIDLARGILTVADAKNGERRYVPLNSKAREALNALARSNKGSEHVCPGTDGRLGRDWQRWFEQAVKLAGVRNLRWHDLRHSFASRLAMAGVPLRTIAELLGHKTLGMVMRYAHLAPAHLQEAVERLAAEPTDTTTDTSQLTDKPAATVYVH